MHFLSLILSFFTLIFVVSANSFAQLPTFTGFWRTPQLTAPTAMAGNNAIQATAHYRMQGFEEGSGYKSYLLSSQIPFFDRANNHFGTLGINLLRDESGSSYLFTTTGLMLTYMYDAALGPRHHLVGGIQGGYYGRKLEWNQVTTNNQFVNGVFDPAISSGEQFPDDPGQAFIANVGLAYYLTDFNGEPIVHFGAALKNANNGSFTYVLNNKNQEVPKTIASYAHFRLISNSYFEVVSDLYWQKNRKVDDVVGGFQFRKGTRPRVKVADNHLGIGLYYSQDHTGIIGLQMIQPNWLIGISYDMVFGNRPLRSMQNAVEVSLGWRAIRVDKQKNMYPKKKRRKLPWKKNRRLPW